HVLARNISPDKVIVDLPGPNDIDLGSNVKHVPIDADHNVVDAAVVSLSIDSSTFQEFYRPFGNCLGSDLSPIPAQLYKAMVLTGARSVTKAGAATKRTFGTTHSVDATVQIDLTEAGFASAGFKDLLDVADLSANDRFATAGDSG